MRPYVWGYALGGVGVLNQVIILCFLPGLNLGGWFFLGRFQCVDLIAGIVSIVLTVHQWIKGSRNQMESRNSFHRSLQCIHVLLLRDRCTVVNYPCWCQIPNHYI